MKDRLNLIVACTPQGIIGKNGKIPWDIPEERKLFKAITSGGFCIMGSKTWDSLPNSVKPLPGRINIVLSKQQLQLPFGVRQADNLWDALSFLDTYTMANHNNRVFFIGGEQVYDEVLEKDLFDRAIISVIKENYSGDRHFDLEQIQKDSRLSLINHKEFDKFVTYVYGRLDPIDLLEPY